MTDHVNDSVCHDAFSYFTALFELDEMNDGESRQVFKAGDLFDPLVIPPDYKLNSSSLMDGSVHVGTKMSIGSRGGSAILTLNRSVLNLS